MQQIRFLAYKTAEATGELIENIVVKPKTLPDVNSRNVGEIVILPNKRKKILKELRQVL